MLAAHFLIYSLYSQLPHNPYLSVDDPGYGIWGRVLWVMREKFWCKFGFGSCLKLRSMGRSMAYVTGDMPRRAIMAHAHK